MKLTLHISEFNLYKFRDYLTNICSPLLIRFVGHFSLLFKSEQGGQPNQNCIRKNGTIQILYLKISFLKKNRVFKFTTSSIFVIKRIAECYEFTLKGAQPCYLVDYYGRWLMISNFSIHLAPPSSVFGTISA